MTQAQLTYAQKVKQKQLQQQQQQGRQQQLQQQLQQTATQSMQQAQAQSQAQVQSLPTIQPVQTQTQTMQRPQQPTAPSNLQTQQSIPRVQTVQPTVTTATVSSTTAKPTSFRMVPAVVQSVQPVPAQSVMRNALSSYSYPYNYSRTRDFFDRGVQSSVQSNVSQAVNQYYSYQRQQQSRSQSRAQPTLATRQSQNRWAMPASRAPQSTNLRTSSQMTSQGRPSQDSRMMRGGGGYGSSSRSRSSANMNGSMNPNPNQNRYSQNGGPPSRTRSSYGPGPGPSPSPNGNPIPRGMNSGPPKARCPPVTSASGPNTPPHRDVLCWIFENQGQCRYGAKCQWLHLDRETGQYVPTMYVTNSLDRKAVKKALTAQTIERENNKKPEAKDKEADSKAAEEPEQDLEIIKSKFQQLMEKGIARREKEKAQSLLEEDTKESKEQSPSGSEKCVPIDSKGSSKSRAKGKGGYGSYGTTFDRHNVCWEFNTFVGCRKGTACKWAHQYLAKESAHPYTGEKLNGLAVKRFRQSNGL